MIDAVGRRTLGSVLAHHARTTPERLCLVFEDATGTVSTWSYAEFDRLVDQTAAAFDALGLRHGQAFNVHLPNRPEFLALWFAAARRGLVMVPTNVALTPDELAYIVAHSESRLMVTDAERLPVAAAVRARCPGVQHLLTIDGERGRVSSGQWAVGSAEDFPHPGPLPLGEGAGDEGTIAHWPLLTGRLPAIAGAHSPTPDPRPPAPTSDDVLALLYTSGTTARPKGCLVTQAAYLYAGECMAKATRSGPADRHLVVLPLFHAGAQTHSVMPALVSGAGVALMHRFSASRFFAQATRHGCTISDLFAAPIRMILNQPAQPDHRTTPLRLVTFAQNITPAELDAWHERCGVPLMQLWGMTETVGLPLMNPLDDRRDNMSLGLPVLGYTVKVVDEAGTEVGPGETGQLLVAGVPGRTLMLGYYKDPAATAATLRDGWLYTGDIVQIGEDGYLRFVDRAKDIIKRAGVNIAAGEIEAVLRDHPAVFDAAVVGVPDPIRDEAIVAFVIPRPGVSVAADDLTDWCQERLARFKLPERFLSVVEFPRTPVGKIQKHLLRVQAVGQEGGQG